MSGSVQRMKGLVGACGGVLTMVHLAIDYHAALDGRIRGGEDDGFYEVVFESIALVPGVIQGVEAMFGEKTGAQKKAAAVEIVGAAINIANAVTMKHIADSDKFTAGVGRRLSMAWWIA